MSRLPLKGDRKSRQDAWKKEKAKEKPAKPKPPAELKYEPVDLYALYDVSSQGFALVSDKEDGVEMLRKHISQSGENPADKRLVRVEEVKLSEKEKAKPYSTV